MTTIVDGLTGHFSQSDMPPAEECSQTPPIACTPVTNFHQDHAWVEMSAVGQPSSEVAPHTAFFSDQHVQGARSPLVGVYVCGFGGVTGNPTGPTKPLCGTIGSTSATRSFGAAITKGHTLTFAGLISADVCSRPGDSGGALVQVDLRKCGGCWGVWAIGTLFGGSVQLQQCSAQSSMTSYYSRVDLALPKFGLQLNTQ